MKTWMSSLRLAIAAMLAVFGLAGGLNATEGSAKILAVRGTATFQNEIGLWSPVQVGQTLQEGSVIQTAAGGEVDLDLGKNGSRVALNESSTLKFAKLSYTESLIGVIAQTSLELKEGTMAGKVRKQAAGSLYDVQTPAGTASVRGTEFFISAKTGEIHVLSGTVVLKLNLNINRATGGGILPAPYKNEVVIGAGQSFFMPKVITSPAAFKSLAATSTPGYVITDPAYLHRAQFLHYNDEVDGSRVGVKETFTAKFVYRRKMPPMAIVDRQPTVAVVSP